MFDDAVVEKYLAAAYFFEDDDSTRTKTATSEGLGSWAWLGWMMFFSLLAWLAVGGLLRKRKKRDGKRN